MSFFKKDNKNISEEIVSENQNIAAPAVQEKKSESYKKVKSSGKVGLTKTELMRRLKYGSLSTVLTIVFIIAVILANILVQTLAYKIPGFTIDTSAYKYYELSDESIEYLGTLDDYEIEIIFIGSKQDLRNHIYYSKICALAENYEKYAENLKVSYVDIDKNPGFTANYDNIELTDGDALVVCGNRYNQLTSADFLYAESDEEDGSADSSTDTSAKEYSLTAEYALTTAIMVVTASDHPQATIITGHGEKELEKLETMLKNNGYDLNRQSIFSEINYDSDILIISAPTKDYSEDDLKKLDDYLYNNGKYGKNVIYVADYTQPVLPNLEAFLYDWGIELESGFVYETDNELVYAGNPGITNLSFIDPNLTLSAAFAEVTACGYYGKPAKIANKLDIDMENTIILQHTETSDIGTATSDGVEGKDKLYPYVAMARTTHSRYSQDIEIMESSLLFVNSTGFFEGVLFERDYFANADITIAAIDDLLGRDNTFLLPSKNLTPAALSISYDQANLIGSIAAIVVPVLILIACLIVYIRRRFS